MDFSIGDFAEQLLFQEQAQAQGSPEPTVQLNSNLHETNHPQAPDISNIDVPDNFIDGLLTESLQGDTPGEASAKNLVPSPSQQTITVDTTELKALLNEFKKVAAVVQNSINEITTVGAIGTGCSCGEKKTTKKKEKKPEDKLKNALARIKAGG